MFPKLQNYFAVGLISYSLIGAQAPAQPQGVKTIYSPGGIKIRYKEPNFCETTLGVKTYSGYVDLDDDLHYYFLFYESRSKPKDDPVTLWLTGGPGSDSLLAAFLENGPCFLTNDDLIPTYNPHSWNNVSNLLFLSQPIGTGFSYSQEAPGTLDDFGNYQPPSVNGIDGVWPIVNYTTYDTTPEAAVPAWHIIQGFFANLPSLASDVKSKSFNLWTESYGGHYGPIFYDYFYNQSESIRKGKSLGIALNFESLGVNNGLYDYKVQAPYFPEFAVNNTYGIVAYNQSIYDYAQISLHNPGGCLASIDYCRATKGVSVIDQAICAEAADYCRNGVEYLLYDYTNLDIYDIRYNTSVPSIAPLNKFLNQGSIQNQLGVSLNWTASNAGIYYAFQQSGDMVYPSSIANIADLLDKGVRVSLWAGDADYICNWFGGEAVSLQIPYSQKAEFAAAGYAPIQLDGKEVGAVRQHGNFSFARIYYAGHQVPYFQPAVALAVYNRTLAGFDVATGQVKVTGSYSTKGSATSDFREG